MSTSSYCHRKCRSKTTSCWFSMITFKWLTLVASVRCALGVVAAIDASDPSTILETSEEQNNYFTIDITPVASGKRERYQTIGATNGSNDMGASSIIQLPPTPALMTERMVAKQTVRSKAESGESYLREPTASTETNYPASVITGVNSSDGESSNLDRTTKVNSDDGHAPFATVASGKSSRGVNVPERFGDSVAYDRLEEPTWTTFRPDASDVEDKEFTEGPKNALHGFMSDEGIDLNNFQNEIPNGSEQLSVPMNETEIQSGTVPYLVSATPTMFPQENNIGHIPAPTMKKTTITAANNSLILRPNKTKKVNKDVSRQNETTRHASKTVVTNSPTRELSTGLRGKASPEPFLVIWNIPSRKCGSRYGILPKLTKYGIIHNAHQHFYGEEIVIFYANHLGFYPRLLADGEVINGGIPQLANMDMHLAKARGDIEKRIPNANFSGYAVIDWESWRPIFRRNWGIHRMYKDRAVGVIARQFPSWNYTTVKAYAKKQFDISARRFISATLSLAKELRPLAKWGFYLFPDCYNFRNGQDYCDKKQTKRNDRLWWLFRASGALYPSIYLTQRLRPKYRAGHIKGILQEGYRIQRTHTSKGRTPVLPYARIRYSDTNFLLSRNDLEGTIGQAATSGSSGIVLWGKYANTVGKRKCVQLQKYVHKILGPFLLTVQRFVKDCSKTLCEGRGRCVRKKHFPSKTRAHHYKHGFVSMFAKHQQRYDKAFRCSCFQGWHGTWCEWKDTYN